jgi:hypothetical protein
MLAKIPYQCNRSLIIPYKEIYFQLFINLRPLRLWLGGVGWGGGVQISTSSHLASSKECKKNSLSDSMETNYGKINKFK